MGTSYIPNTATFVVLWLVAFVLAFLPAAAVASWAIWMRRRDARRSPLTTELHHLPGESAGSWAETLHEKGNDRLALSMAIGPIVVAMWALMRINPRSVHFGWFEGWLLIGILIVSFLSARSALKLMRERRNYLDGLIAERATAQSLAPLISMGCAIYNDIPGENFNLDHVVIGPDRVYMVETKSRRKPPQRSKQNAHVRFDGHALQFPGWHEAKPLDQVRAQVRWLADYLYRTIGERVRVEGVLALPGWFVSQTVPTVDVHVINPGMHKFMADCKGARMPEPQRRRIMTALEDRYRSGQKA